MMLETFYPSSSEMQQCDLRTIAEGVSSFELMNRAGVAVLDLCLADAFLTDSDSCCILCGAGNNGGDGLVIYRELLRRSFSCSLLIVASAKYSKDFLDQFETLPSKESCFLVGEDPDCPLELPVTHEIPEAVSVVFDCLLGTGQRGAPRGSVALALEMLAQYKDKKPITCIAVDVPTGIDADTGQVFV
ncbi:MAG: NAD(P)H-hydrate epimerase, partial [Bdellovibrionales bacterium]|nr:NAD(P)H-hydrate epimerase [Bdellovibrionales bacterium]